jgi:hypothetical protein
MSCPNCELEDWRPVDDLATDITCEFCGHIYNSTPFLPERPWTFRCSGLFRRFPNRQEGAIPVVVLLQQLATHIGGVGGSGSVTAISTCTDVKVSAATKCETDFVWMMNRDDGLPIIAIGECKGQGRVDANDVANLNVVAERLRERGFETYVVLAKWSAFSPDEVAICRAHRVPGVERLIMLSAAELEPYELWQQQRLGARWYPSEFETLAAITAEAYFGPLPEGPRDGQA